MPSTLPYKTYSYPAHVVHGRFIGITVYAAGQTACAICGTKKEAVLFTADINGRVSSGICINCYHKVLAEFKDDHGKLSTRRE